MIERRDGSGMRFKSSFEQEWYERVRSHVLTTSDTRLMVSEGHAPHARSAFAFVRFVSLYHGQTVHQLYGDDLNGELIRTFFKHLRESHLSSSCDHSVDATLSSCECPDAEGVLEKRGVKYFIHPKFALKAAAARRAAAVAGPPTLSARPLPGPVQGARAATPAVPSAMGSRGVATATPSGGGAGSGGAMAPPLMTTTATPLIAPPLSQRSLAAAPAPSPGAIMSQGASP
jgi:hypothetical protein